MPEPELLQGTLDLLILKSLALDKMHGIGISRRISQITDGAFEVKAGSLFPALHRMGRIGHQAPFQVLQAHPHRPRPPPVRIAALGARLSRHGKRSPRHLKEDHMLRALFQTLFRKKRAEQELDDELAAYLEQTTAENVRRGMTPEAALQKARRDLGGMEQVKENVRAVRVGVSLD